MAEAVRAIHCARMRRMSMPSSSGGIRLLLLLVLAAAISSAEEIRLIRSLSGPSGKVIASDFAFDETRNRFVYPRDRSFVVYFVWAAPTGSHTLTAIWKQPDGRVGSISPDVRMVSEGGELKCYWNYNLAGGMLEGIWTVEIRIDGQPAGSHALEIVGTAPIAEQRPTTTPENKQRPTLDEIFRTVSASLATVHKLDEDGRRVDTASAFVMAKNRVATSFQAVDGSSRLRLQFNGGRTAETDELLHYSRTGDWAVMQIDTGDIPALAFGEPAKVAVGDRLIAFNVENGARVIGGVDISGRRDVPVFGPRINISPGLVAEASGGPLLDLDGRVVGIIGGSLMPGSRTDQRSFRLNPGVWDSASGLNAAVPISALPAKFPDNGSKLSDLASKAILTAPLSNMDELVYAATSRTQPKNLAGVRDMKVAISFAEPPSSR
jgi:S1-C subfamily serine protease